jgi:hypothetical protein
MSPEKQSPHVLFVRWGKFELQALGIPAVIAVVVFTIVGARWLGLI